jgi:glyoxylase-like metal-dependent hydrolase (beta-lactamase superfamily II)
MLVKKFTVGPIETNCYIAAGGTNSDAIIIDPDIRTSREKAKILSTIKKFSLELRYIVNTHYHVDHIGGNEWIKKTTGARILIHQLDAPLLKEPWKPMIEMDNTGKAPDCWACGKGKLTVVVIQQYKRAMVSCNKCSGVKFELLASPPADRLLDHGDEIKVGKLKFKILHTPGHSPGGICLYAEKEKTIFTGDTLFTMSMGRTDLPDGSPDDMARSLKKLMKLPASTIAYPGHGEKTTIGREKQKNPHITGKKPAPKKT